MLDEHTTEEAKNSANSLDFYDIGIAEIVLMPSSNLINQTIKRSEEHTSELQSQR